jgi:type II secretory pathway component PulK
VALLLVVSMVLLLSVLVGAMVVSAGHSRAISDNALADLQNSAALRSGYQFALLYLQADAQESAEVDALHEPWAQPRQIQVGRATVTIRIEDVERRFNLSRLVRTDGRQCPETVARARRLFQLLGQDPDLVDRIADYADADGLGLYEARARNDLPAMEEELLRVEGIEPETLYGAVGGGTARLPLEPFVTVWPRERTACKGSGDLAVNVNTADARVLMALSDRLSEREAQEIVAYRGTLDAEGRPASYSSLQDLRAQFPSMEAEVLTEVGASLVYKSNTFRIEVTSRTGNLGKQWVYLVRRGGGGKGTALLTQYQRHEMREMPKPGE